MVTLNGLVKTKFSTKPTDNSVLPPKTNAKKRKRKHDLINSEKKKSFKTGNRRVTMTMETLFPHVNNPPCPDL